MKKYLILLVCYLLLSSCEKGMPCRSGVFTDSRDGHEYRWVKRGKQIWMAENLAYLPEIFSYHNNNYENWYYVRGYRGENASEARETDFYINYGVLYSWTAAQSSCPSGWSLPSHKDWGELFDFLSEKGLGFGAYETGIAKSLASTSGWKYCDMWGTPGNSIDTNNSSGLNIKPGGFTHEYGSANFGLWEFGESVRYWSSGSYFDNIKRRHDNYISLSYNSVNAYKGFCQGSFPIYIRCIKD